MPYAVARTDTRNEGAGRYQCRRPEQTLLYRIVEEYYPVFAGHLAEQGRELPDHMPASSREVKDVKSLFWVKWD